MYKHINWHCLLSFYVLKYCKNKRREQMACGKPSITGDFSPSVGVGVNVWRRCRDAGWCERLWPAQEATPTLQAGAALLLASDHSGSRRTRGPYQSGPTDLHRLPSWSLLSRACPHTPWRVTFQRVVIRIHQFSGDLFCICVLWIFHLVGESESWAVPHWRTPENMLFPASPLPYPALRLHRWL